MFLLQELYHWFHMYGLIFIWGIPALWFVYAFNALFALWFKRFNQSHPEIPVIWLVHTCHSNALIGQNPRGYSARKYQTIAVLIGMWFYCSYWPIALLSLLWLVHTCEPSALVGRAWFSWHRRPGTCPGARGRRAPHRSRAAGAPLPRTETI